MRPLGLKIPLDILREGGILKLRKFCYREASVMAIVVCTINQSLVMEWGIRKDPEVS